MLLNRFTQASLKFRIKLRYYWRTLNTFNDDHNCTQFHGFFSKFWWFSIVGWLRLHQFYVQPIIYFSIELNWNWLFFFQITTHRKANGFILLFIVCTKSKFYAKKKRRKQLSLIKTRTTYEWKSHLPIAVIQFCFSLSLGWCDYMCIRSHLFGDVCSTFECFSLCLLR